MKFYFLAVQKVGSTGTNEATEWKDLKPACLRNLGMRKAGADDIPKLEN